MEQQQRPVAIYLAVTGGLAVVFNLVGLLPFLRFRRKTLHGSPSALPLFAILLIDLLIAIVQIFPTLAAASDRWPYSDAGCMAYAAVEFYLSAAQISLVTFIALDRYLITCEPTWETWRSVVNYQKTLFFFGSVGALWCTLPMIGWGSYAPSPSRVACTIDWSRTDHAYVSFLTGTFLLLFLVPFCSAAALYYSTYEFVKRANSAEARDENAEAVVINCNWAPQNHVGKISLGCLLASNVAHLGYGFVSLNPFNHDRDSINFNIFPMLMSKLAGVVNPIFYVRFNPELWRFTCATFCCRPMPAEILVEVCCDDLSEKSRSPKKTDEKEPLIDNYQNNSIVAAYNAMSLFTMVPTIASSAQVTPSQTPLPGLARPRRQLPPTPQIFKDYDYDCFDTKQ